MQKIRTQTQNCNHKNRYSQHYPRLITGNYISNDPANTMALRGLRIAKDYQPQHIPEYADAHR